MNVDISSIIVNCYHAVSTDIQLIIFYVARKILWDIPGVLHLPCGTRDKSSRSRTVPDVPGQSAVMNTGVTHNILTRNCYNMYIIWPVSFTIQKKL